MIGDEDHVKAITKVVLAQVPLMRNPQGTEDVCVTCGKVIPVVDAADHDEGFRGDDEVTGVEEQGVGTMLLNTRRDEEEYVTRDDVYRAWKENGKKNDGLVQTEKDVSGLLADRMMKGWVLLSEHCPRCDTPLVRKKKGMKSSETVNGEEQMFCVGCALPVVKVSSLNNNKNRESIKRDVAKDAQAEKEIGSSTSMEGMVACNAALQGSLVDSCKTCVEETSLNVAKYMFRLSMRLAETSDTEMKGIIDSIQSCAVVLRDLQQAVA